jgi:hypothetical protein
MKTNFSPKVFRGLDPISAAAGGLQTILGIGQSIFSGRKKAERALNSQIDAAPKTTANASILDFYNKALSRYNVNPYNSSLYKHQSQTADRNLVSALGSTGGRSGRIGALGGLLQNTNDSLLKAASAAEGQQAQALSQLGSATGMKSNEDERVFEQNVNMPYNLRLQLKAQNLQGANQRTNAGMQNLFGGLGTLGSSYTKKG